MDQRRIGQSGLTVSALSHGCMGYGQAAAIRDRADMIQLIRHAFDQDMDFFDTAEAYGPSTNDVMQSQASDPFILA